MKLKLALAEADEELILIKYGFRPTSLDSISSGELVVDDSKAITMNCQNREFTGHIELCDGSSYVNCVLAGTANGEVKLFKVKNKVSLKLHNYISLPAFSSVADANIHCAAQVTGNIKEKPSSEKNKKKRTSNSVTEIMKRKKTK